MKEHAFSPIVVFPLCETLFHYFETKLHALIKNKTPKVEHMTLIFQDLH